MSERLEQLKKLHALDPQDPFLTYGIALELSKKGDGDAALDWLDQTLARDADYFYAYFQKGQILAGLDRLPEAEAALDEGIRRAQAGGDAHAVSELQSLRASLSTS